jgi:hypothetical protein
VIITFSASSLRRMGTPRAAVPLMGDDEMASPSTLR